MKRPPVIILAALAVFPLLPAQQEEGKRVFRDAATHESLVPILREATASDPMKDLEKSEGEDPSKENRPQNLIESSDLISFQGVTTLVPKRAIMMVPENFKDRINNHTPGNRVVGWLDFYAMNLGWITTVEISRGQAGGNEPLSEGLSEQLAKSKNMVVTVMESGPISSMPYRGDEDKKKEVETK